MSFLRRRLAIPAVALATALVFACDRAPASQPAVDSTDAALARRYVDPPPVRSFPTTAAAVNGWIANRDTVSIRKHGWDLWESITSQVIGANGRLPAWETWYSGHEVFEMPQVKADSAIVHAEGEMGNLVIPRSEVPFRLEIPSQFIHGPLLRRGHIPSDRAGAVFSFNRFTRTTAQQIVFRRLWDATRLIAINDSFNRAKTPVAQRAILVSKDSTDSMSVVLKPVFQFIDGTQPSCISYWAGDTPAVTDSAGMNPVPMLWKQFVLVDVKGQVQGEQSKAGVKYPGCPDSTQSYKVVRLDRFYYRVLTQAMVDSFSTFALGSGDDLGSGDSSTAAAIREMIKVGNVGLLVAMHVTGKEIANWTWQSFWWSPFPNDSLGKDRPRTIRSPWNNYQMTTAYFMASPQGVGRVAYNPYLETSLTNIVDTSGYAGPRWFGPQTNCMSCHRNASWRDTVVVDSTGKKRLTFSGAPYVPAGFVDPGNAAFFAHNTKVDFLWSIGVRARNFPPAPAPPGAKGRPGS